MTATFDLKIGRYYRGMFTGVAGSQHYGPPSVKQTCVGVLIMDNRRAAIFKIPVFSFINVKKLPVAATFA